MTELKFSYFECVFFLVVVSAFIAFGGFRVGVPSQYKGSIVHTLYWEGTPSRKPLLNVSRCYNCTDNK